MPIQLPPFAVVGEIDGTERFDDPLAAEVFESSVKTEEEAAFLRSVAVGTIACLDAGDIQVPGVACLQAFGDGVEHLGPGGLRRRGTAAFRGLATGVPPKRTAAAHEHDDRHEGCVDRSHG